MKPYNERLPMIDAAIDYYKGKLPLTGNQSSSIVVYAHGKFYFISEEYFNTCGEETKFVCYEEEFEQRKAELAAKEQEMNNDWYEKGELPPANTECEVKIEGQWLPTVVIGHYANEAIVVDPCVTVQRFFCTTANNLRPLQSETDMLVDEALEALKSDYAIHLSLSDLDLRMCAETMIEAGYRKIKPMSRDEVISKIFGLADHIGMADAATLYDAGCRFIDQKLLTMKPYNKRMQSSETDCVPTQKKANIAVTNWNTNAVGAWIIGGDMGSHIQVYKQPTEEQIKNTQELLGWKWKSY